MATALWGRRGGGSGGGVVTPIVESEDRHHHQHHPSDEDENGTDRQAKSRRHRRRPSPVPHTATRPVGGWIPIFIAINLFGICGFIFGSAWFFPSVTTSGIVDDVLHGNAGAETTRDRATTESDLALVAHLAATATSETPALPTPTANDDTNGVDLLTLSKAELRKHTELRATKSTRVRNSASPAVSAVLASSPTMATTIFTPSVEPSQVLSGRGRHSRSQEVDDANATPTPMSTSTTTSVPPLTNPESIPKTSSQSPPSLDTANAQATANSPSPPEASVVPTPMPPLLGQDSLPPEPSSSAGPQLKIKSMTELIAQIKARQATNAARTDPPTMIPLTPHQPDVSASSPSTTLGATFDKSISVWLRADLGVQVEDRIECETTGHACEVRSWTNSAQSTTSEFVAATDPRRRPAWQPQSLNSLPAISLACPMTSESRTLHNTLTAFFVLSPSVAELNLDQSFLSVSGIGQFLFHAGRPAFAAARGGNVYELDQVIRNDEFMLIAYRVTETSVEIRINNEPWGVVREALGYGGRTRSPPGSGPTIRLGNIDGACDIGVSHGLVGEVLVFDAILGDDQSAAVIAYLREKWWVRDGKGKTVVGAGATAPRSIDHVPVKSATVQSLSTAPPPLGPATTSEEGNGESTTTPQRLDPEGVFEWTPSDTILRDLGRRGIDAAPLLAQWTAAVRDSITKIRNFPLGGGALRSLIRQHRDELDDLRHALFVVAR